MRIPLPNDQWAEVRTAEEILEEDRESVLRAMSEAGDDFTLRGYAGRRQWLIRLVQNWSFEQPLPSVEPKALGKLPLKSYNTLVKYVDTMLAEFAEDEDTDAADSPPVPSDS